MQQRRRESHAHAFSLVRSWLVVQGMKDRMDNERRDLAGLMAQQQPPELEAGGTYRLVPRVGGRLHSGCLASACVLCWVGQWDCLLAASGCLLVTGLRPQHSLAALTWLTAGAAACALLHCRPSWASGAPTCSRRASGRWAAPPRLTR